MRRLEEMLWPPKGKAALRAIGWGIFALFTPTLCSWLNDPDGGFWFGVALLIAAMYGGVWFYKFSRDRKLATQAEEQRVAQTTFEYHAAPQRTTPGSERIRLTPNQRPPESV